MVLGAGGSARAVVYGLVRAGWEVAIASRRPDRCRELAHSLHLQSQVDVLPMTENDLGGYLSVMGDNIRLVINTTSIGMYPKIDQCIFAWDCLHTAGLFRIRFGVQSPEDEINRRNCAER